MDTARELLSAAALLAAALSASAFNVAVTAEPLKADIDNCDVEVSIVHSCSNGEGYTGEAKLTCGGESRTQGAGFGEDGGGASFPNVAELFSLDPGAHTFVGEVTLTDLKGGKTTASDSVTVDFCRWKTAIIEPYSPCEDWTVTLHETVHYTGEPEFELADSPGVTTKGGLSISRAEREGRDSVKVHVFDDDWGASRDFGVSTDFEAGDAFANGPGELIAKLDGVDISLPLARMAGEHASTLLSLEVKARQWSPELLSRKSLCPIAREHPAEAGFLIVDLGGASVSAAAPWRAVRNRGGLVQLKYPDGFTDITNRPAGGYAITGYALMYRPPFWPNGGRYIAATNQPVLFHYDVLPREPEIVDFGETSVTNNGLVITGWRAGGATNTWEYVYAADPEDEDGSADWRLVTKGLVREGRTTARLAPDLRATRARTFPAQGGPAVADTLTVERNFPWGWTRVAEVVDPDGLALSNSWTYAEEGEGRYGRLVSHTDENDVTTTYEYDAEGRTAAMTAPTPSGLRRTEYSYAMVDPRENAQSPAQPHTARTTTESIAGVVVARTWRAVFEEGDRRTTITERAASQSAAYGDAGNLRDESVSYATAPSLGRLAGRPISRLSRDGTLTTYSYASGLLSAPGETGFRTFAAADTNAFLRVSALRASAAAPDGVPNVSTIDVSVYDELDNEVYSETRVVTGPGSSEPISWKSSEYDAYGRLLSSLSSDGSREEYAYGEHGPVWHRDASGTVTTTEYDALGRAVRTVVDDGTGHPKTTETAYDALGRVLTETKWAESSSTNSAFCILHSAFGYDAAGRVVAESTPDGQETRTSYGRIQGTPFFYTETVTLPCAARADNPGAFASTNRSVRYKCGIAAWTEFNGERRTTHAYGVNPDGTQWTETYNGPDGTSSPAWTMTVSDFLGGASGCGGSGSRTASEFRPAFGGGAIETRSEYDAPGRLVATRSYHIPDGGADRLLAATGYGYDALGNRVLTVRDADGDGAFTLSGADAATSNATRYVKLEGDWWREATAFTFPVSGSSEAIPVSRTRERLTGLGTVTENGCLVSETRSLTYPSTAETVTRTYADRESRTSLTVTESPASELPARAFSVGGLLVSNVTATGVSTAYAYDALGRTASVTDGRGNTTTYAYDSYGNLVSETDATGATTTYAYDALNRRIAVADPLGNTTYTAYDAEGRTIAQWGATYPVLYSYDPFGRLATLSTTRDEEAVGQLATDHWPLATDTSWDTTRWLYDESTGLLTNKLYADGIGPSYAYTPDGKLSSRLWARGILTSYAYDFAGTLTNVMHNAQCTMHNGGGDNPVNPVETTYTYDRSGHMLSATVPGVSTNHYFYSVHGQLTNEVQNGVVLSRAYDALNRPTGYSLNLVNPVNPVEVSYSYDSLGRFSGVGFNAEAQSGGVDFEYSYLPNTDLISGKTATTGDNSAFCILHSALSYEPHRDLISAVTNAAFNPSTLQPFNLSTFAYLNDAAGRRVEVTRTGAAFGALAGATDAYGYNARSEVVSARRTIGNSEVRGFDYDYAYDPIGNRTSATYYDEQGEAVASAYSANALNQYTQRTVPGNVQVRGEADTGAVVTVNENPTWRNGEYFYGGDYADNSAVPVFKEVEIAAVVPASSPDGWDEMSAVTGRVFVAQNPERFTYDADGNMTCDGRFRYTWNAENRLVRAQELVAPTNRHPYTVSYAYDHRGRMVSKRITENDGNDTLVKSVSYLWDGWNIIREVVRDGGGTATSTDNVWGLDLDGTLQGAGGVGGLLAVLRSDCAATNSAFGILHSALYLPTYDANGNVSEYVTTNGEIVAHYDYSPFGEMLIESGDLASTFTHRFSTKPWCPVTGLCEYQMRKYRSEIGRWLSRDPIEEEGKGGINLMVFALNDAIGKRDIRGRSVDTSGMRILGALKWPQYDKAYNAASRNEVERRPAARSAGFTSLVVDAKWDIEPCADACCFKLVLKQDVTVSGTIAWRKFLDAHDSTRDVYSDGRSYHTFSGRTVEEHEKLHRDNALIMANSMDRDLHMIIDGQCVSKICAQTKWLYLASLQNYHALIREYDDLRLDYDDHFEGHDKLLNDINASIVTREAAWRQVEQYKARMERRCGQ